MKKNKLFRILAMAVILALLMIAIPATPALAASMTLSASSGPPGTAVTVTTGTGFTVNGSGCVWFDIDGDYIRDSGEPYLSATVSGGNLSAPGTITVPTVPRGTYAVVVSVPCDPTYDAAASFTVTPEIELDESSGNVGDTITVDGYGFNDSATVTIYYDGESVGTDYTDDDGTFEFTFTVPDSTKGTHTVRARDSYYSPTVNFTVSPEVTISSSSGAVGDTITVSGTGFAASSDIIIYFDGSIVDTDDTNADGSFSGATFNVPETSRGSHTIKAKDEDNNYDTATFTVAQKITIDPTNGSSGITVTVTGTSFKASYTITIKYNGTTVATSPTTVTTNSTGYFSATFTVPASMAGTYEVEATDGTNTATADFVSTTDATISQTTTTAAPGYVGMTLTITGTGFTPSATVTVTYETTPVTLATVPTDASGNFTAPITIPPSLGGVHTITVSDGSVTKVFDFYMESTPPPTPQPQLPLLDGKLEDGRFDWDDVIDLSLPITYDLQIATDANFTDILVEHTGLTTSEYTLLESEELESTSEEEPYYWRVRAIDAASNVSGWTGAATFSVGFTFPEITGWLMYVIMAAIAVAFFFFGFWLGTRRASIGDEFA